MKVYSLIEFVDYEGSDLVGVFGSVEDVLKCVESGNGKWFCDDLGYVESELGEKIRDVLGVVEYVSFVDYRNKKVEVSKV
jgi:hypothetical protein